MISISIHSWWEAKAPSDSSLSLSSMEVSPLQVFIQLNPAIFSSCLLVMWLYRNLGPYSTHFVVPLHCDILTSPPIHPANTSAKL